jgi:hypothetical protein
LAPRANTDGNACTSSDACGAGICQSGASLDCDDLNPCTADACDEFAGCTHDPIALCGAVEVPGSNPTGRVLLAMLLLCAGALLRHRPSPSA